MSYHTRAFARPDAELVVIGIDLGGSASMTAAAFYWPETNRLECLGTFPSKPTLLDRGQNDGVSGRYVEMQDRGELSTLGDQTVPIAPWLIEIMAHVEGEPIAAITADRYKQAELGEAIEKAGIRCPIIPYLISVICRHFGPAAVQVLYETEL